MYTPMKNVLFLLFLLIVASSSCAIAQTSSGRVLLSGGLDAYRTDHKGAFEKYQIGLEANVFVSSRVALTFGYEHRTHQVDAIALGYRAYVLEPLFVRVKPLIATNDHRNTDLNIGIGYNHYLGGSVSIEFTGDYYFRNRLAGLRIAIAGLL